MTQEDKKLITKIEDLYQKFLLELQDLEERRQEILNNRSRTTLISTPENAERITH